MSGEIHGPNPLRSVVGWSPGAPSRSIEPGRPDFDASLERLLDPLEASETPGPEPAAEAPHEPGVFRPVVLSRHAASRLSSRGLSFGPTEASELGDALTSLERRGAKRALVLTGQQAWIVGVPKRTVITVMSREEALGQVFTDLDATYLAG
ncbi:MAG: hypothetical protein AAGA48_06395 [Myxococcota bacterium]